MHFGIVSLLGELLELLAIQRSDVLSKVGTVIDAAGNINEKMHLIIQKKRRYRGDQVAEVCSDSDNGCGNHPEDTTTCFGVVFGRISRIALVFLFAAMMAEALVNGAMIEVNQ